MLNAKVGGFLTLKGVIKMWLNRRYNLLWRYSNEYMQFNAVWDWHYMRNPCCTFKFILVRPRNKFTPKSFLLFLDNHVLSPHDNENVVDAIARPKMEATRDVLLLVDINAVPVWEPRDNLGWEISWLLGNEMIVQTHLLHVFRVFQCQRRERLSLTFSMSTKSEIRRKFLLARSTMPWSETMMTFVSTITGKILNILVRADLVDEMWYSIEKCK